MAGEIKSYISPINFKVNPAQDFGYYESLMSSKRMVSLENYLSDTVSEEAILKLLSSKDKKAQGLESLEKHLYENQGILMVHDKQSLFKKFASILVDCNDKTKTSCTKLLFKIIPQLGSNLDNYMNNVINQIINNVGSQTISLKKESILALHIYMKHSTDVSLIFRAIAHEGINHKVSKKRQEIILTFPTLLLPEFKNEDFFDIVHHLAKNLTEDFVQHELVLNVLNKICDFIGKKAFNHCIHRLSSPLKQCYLHSAAKNNNMVVESNLANSKKTSVFPDSVKDFVNDLALIESNSHDTETMLSQKHHTDKEHSFFPLNSLSTAQRSFTQSDKSQLSFISKELIGNLSNNDHTVRLKALDTLKEVLCSLQEPTHVLNNVLTLISLLQSPILDRNCRVSCAALQVVNKIVLMLGSELSKYTKVFVNAVSKKIGNNKDMVRSEYYNVLLNIMSVVGYQKVLDLLFEKLNCKQSKIKEDCLCLIIATLLMSKFRYNNDLNFPEICRNVSNCLTDSQPAVRRASLECIAVLGYILGSTNKEILSAVDKVELRHDNATGIMAAVQARLLKAQLPRLKENLLVEYADFPASTSVASLQGADIQWIAAVEKSRKSSFSNVYGSHDHLNKYSSSNSIKTADSNSINFSQGRRLPSAGKQNSFPWTKNSAPPFQPKNIWGSENEIPSSTVKVQKSHRNKHGDDGSPSYVELHNRKIEALSNKLSASPKLSYHSASSKSSGYQPSFATNHFEGGPTGVAVTSSALSSSCPTSFFEKNSVARPRRIKPQTSPNNSSSPRASVSPDENASPIRLKPALARSASKRRDYVASNGKELLRVDSSPANTPIKLKSESGSPRLDHVLFSTPTEQMRSTIASHSHNNSNDVTEKFSGPVADLLMEDVSSSPSPVGYTPSPLQRKSATLLKSDSYRKSPLTLDKEFTRSEPLFDDDVSLDAKRDPPSPRPIISSHFSPSRRRSSEELPENAFNSIRRSAQNKRERMKINDDSFNGSFTQFARDPDQLKASSNLMNDAVDSFSNLETNPVPTPVGNLPSLKYSPNTGKTFESKKVDSDVSVVGVGYPSQSSFTPPNSAADTRSSNFYSSSATPTTINSTAVLPNKFSPLALTSDKAKAYRASVQSFVGSSSSPEPSDGFFNIQGRGVFMTSPSTPLTSGVEIEPSTLKKSEPDTDHLIDGICGVAVKQPGYSPEEFSFGQKPANIPISLSASLKEQKERKEKSRKLSKTLTYGESLEGRLSGLNLDDDPSDAGQKSSRDFGTRSLNRTSGSTERSSGNLAYNGTASKSGSSHSVSLTPLDNPEKSLSDAVSALTHADSEDWEVMTQGMYTIRRLATHHPVVLASRFYDVIALLNKHVPSLRSQVSKSSVQAITDLYTHLEKPVVDTSLDTTIRTLLLEHGKKNSFMKQESSKSLQAIIKVASATRVLNALLNTGLKHKNNDVRDIAAKFCMELADKMGPGKALSGVRDTTDRLLNALVSFTSDKSEEVRYYGRRIVNLLMNHEDFNSSLDRYLSSDDSQTIKNVASGIRQRGLAPPSSLGPRRSEKSGRKKVVSPPSVVVGRVQPTTILPGRVKGAKSFNDQNQDQEKLKALCVDLSEGDFSEKKSAVISLFQKINRDRRFVEDNIVKIMSAYVTLLNTAQTKLNSLGLEHLPELITTLHSHFRDVTPQLVPALIKLSTSKQHSALSLQCIDLLVKHVDHLWIIQPFATSAMYCGNAKAKQIAINTVTKLIERVASRKIAIVERQVLPVLWSLLTAQNAPNVALLRRDVEQLASELHRVLGRRLFDCAETQNLTAKVKQILDA